MVSNKYSLTHSLTYMHMHMVSNKYSLTYMYMCTDEIKSAGSYWNPKCKWYKSDTSVGEGTLYARMETYWW